VILREAGAAALSAAFVALAAIQCWAVQDSAGTPVPTAPITTEQRTAARALVIDAMLDPTDIPAGLTERSIGREEGNQHTLQGYLEDGWLMFSSNAWVDGTAGVLLVQETVYAFEDEARAAAFASAQTTDSAAIPGATQIPTSDAAPGQQRSLTEIGGDEHWLVELTSRVGRLVVSLDVDFVADRTDWQDVALALLATAEQRAQEALTPDPSTSP
jgi:hypothetical protein